MVDSRGMVIGTHGTRGTVGGATAYKKFRGRERVERPYVRDYSEAVCPSDAVCESEAACQSEPSVSQGSAWRERPNTCQRTAVSQRLLVSQGP